VPALCLVLRQAGAAHVEVGIGAELALEAMLNCGPQVCRRDVREQRKAELDLPAGGVGVLLRVEIRFVDALAQRVESLAVESAASSLFPRISAMATKLARFMAFSGDSGRARLFGRLFGSIVKPGGRELPDHDRVEVRCVSSDPSGPIPGGVGVGFAQLSHMAGVERVEA